MGAKLKSVAGKTVRLEVTVELADSMLGSEEAILSALNDAGVLATETALERFDTDGATFEQGGVRWHCKGRLPKRYQTPYGEALIKRHVYQRAGGGKTFVPLEERARLVGDTTPRFAKMVAHKYANGPATQVREDLMANHGRTVARSYLHRMGEMVGAIAQAKEEEWTYHTPEVDQSVDHVAVGLDGTCMLMCEDGWREAMTGTVSLYDREGERLHSIYIGATPEYGKDTFYQRMEREIAHVKQLYPTARYVGLADGDHTNWSFLEGKVSEQIIDFYHAAGYVGTASNAALPTDPLGRPEWTEERCHRLKHEPGAADRLLTEWEELSLKRMSKENKKDLHSAITYFRNHKDKMDYARYQAEGLPIGSGVTEAGCKTLIKQRLCQAGMRWKEKGAGAVLSLRSLVLTNSRWDQFWDKINQYGVPAAA